jgi:hypothetical protein
VKRYAQKKCAKNNFRQVLNCFFFVAIKQAIIISVITKGASSCNKKKTKSVSDSINQNYLDRFSFFYHALSVKSLTIRFELNDS